MEVDLLQVTFKLENDFISLFIYDLGSIITELLIVKIDRLSFFIGTYSCE